MWSVMKSGHHGEAAANVIQTRPLQSAIDDLSFVVAWSSRPLSTSHRSARWLERVHGKHEVVGLNPTQANFLYGIENA